MVKGEGEMDFRGLKLSTTMSSPAELREQEYVETMDLSWECQRGVDIELQKDLSAII